LPLRATQKVKPGRTISRQWNVIACKRFISSP
jgi:hypothetical protein